MDRKEKKNIIYQEFKDRILLNDYSKKLKWIRAIADRAYSKRINAQST
ncbi:MAG: hypothetical protein GYB37_14780 [Algicola sp.]|nr:hypothetical protein [Algicola sp.]